MAQDELRQAIQLMQDGQAEVAAGMLKRLVEGSALDAKGRAAAYVWLAEAREDRAFKRRCLEQALACEPDNVQIRQGLNQLLEQPAPPEHLPPMRPKAEKLTELEQAPIVVGVDGGLNGLASGVFVGRDGLLATTSYAMGGAEKATVYLDGERKMAGSVARRYPQVDLALIATPLDLARKPSVAPPAMIAENSAFVAHCYSGARLRGVLIPEGRATASHWLGTNIPPITMPDAGGNPLVDASGHLLGLLTRNVGRAGNACALKMTQIMALVEQFRRERQLMPAAGYCRTCGGLARALQFGGRTCETCGARLAAGGGQAAPSEQLMQLYGENVAAPCRHCGARVGDYAGRCLRCGFMSVAGEVAGG